MGKSICIYHSYIMCSTDVRGPKQCWCLWQEPFFQLTYPIFCLLPSWLVNPRGYFYHHPFGSSRDRVSVKVVVYKSCVELPFISAMNICLVRCSTELQLQKKRNIKHNYIITPSPWLTLLWFWEKIVLTKFRVK